MKTVQLRTGAWCGDKTIQLQFPKDWEIIRLAGNPPKAMSDKGIKKSLLKPINASSLIKLARGKKNAVIVIDDIMRPTPTARILPRVIELLEKGGIAKSAIKIVIAGGSHPKISKEDIKQKVGEKLVSELIVIAHDDSNNLVFLGHTERGTPMYVNRIVMESDLKIAVGGIYPHPSAAYSGGAKIFVPGVCGNQTIEYLHATLKSDKWGGRLDNEFRDEIVAIAKKIELHFAVNVVLTPTRDIGGVFAGDMVDAHEKGVRAVKEHYGTQTIHDADIVISNTYPFDASYYFFHRGYWPLTIGENSRSPVLIVNGSMGKDRYCFKSPRQSRIDRWRHTWNFLWSVIEVWYKPRLFRARLRQLLFMKWRKFFLFYTGHANEAELATHFSQAKIFRDWDELLSILKASHHGKRVKVAVYPYASLELPIDTL